MLLKDYLKEKKIKPYVFANSIGLTPSTLYNFLSGKSRIGKDWALVIEEVTGGEVTVYNMLWPEAFVD